MLTEKGKPTKKQHTSLSQLSNRKTVEALEVALYKADDRQDCNIEAIKAERTDRHGELLYRIKWEGFPANAVLQHN